MAAGAVLSAVSVSGLSLPAVAHPAAPFLPPDPGTTSAELKVLGHSDLGSVRKGNTGEVTVLGNIAVVASGIQPAGGLRTHMYTPYPCPQSKVKLVNITNPASPSVVGNIVIPSGVVARDVAALKVKAIGASATPYKLLGIALATCGGAGNLVSRGLAYYDITNAAAPVFKGRYMADLEQFDAVATADGPLPNDALTFTSNYDSARKSATIELVNPGAAGPISVNVVNPGATTPVSNIVVTLAHDGTNVTSTANDVRNAMNANTAAKSLVVTAFTGATTGGDVMTPLPQTNLVVDLSATACPPNCASSQDSISLAQLSDGRVLSTGTEPFATFSQSATSCSDDGPLTFSNGAGTFPNCPFPSGDLRIVDVTDPTNPVQIGDLNPRRSDPTGAPPPTPPASNLGAENPSVNGGFSKNGCRSFTGIMSAELNANGTKAVAADFDDGLIDITMTPPAGPATFSESAAAVANAYIDPNPVGDRDVEGNASFATFAGPTNNLALLSDQDWIAPDTTVRIDGLGAGTANIAAGSYKACEAMWTLFDPEDTAQIFRSLDSQVPGGLGNSVEFVYVGRGCPTDAFIKDSAGNPVSVAGKIAVVDRNRNATRQPGIPAAGCSTVDKANQMQQNGAIAVVVDAQQPGGYAFAPDGAPAGASIPLVAIDAPHGANLITTLCQAPYATSGTGQCGGHTTVTGALVDSAPSGGRSPWGALHIMDLSSSTKVGEYRTPRSQQFPPPDLGVYSVHHAVAKGNRAYVAWNSDGLRVLDLTNPASPTEVSHFIPFHTGHASGHLDDPNGILPKQAYVVGVAIAGTHPNGGCKLAVTDIHGGLWMLRDPGGPC